MTAERKGAHQPVGGDRVVGAEHSVPAGDVFDADDIVLSDTTVSRLHATYGANRDSVPPCAECGDEFDIDYRRIILGADDQIRHQTCTCAVCRLGISRDETVFLLQRGVFAHLGCVFDMDQAPDEAAAVIDALTWQCDQCRRRMFTDSRPVKYCTAECAAEAHNESRRALPTTLECSECGDEFRPARSDATTCSPRCRQRRRRRLSHVPAASAVTRDMAEAGMS